MMLCRYCVIPIVARMTMRDTTTSSSIMVKPEAPLPVSVFRSIECNAVEGGVDVVDVLAAPFCRIGLVLVRAQAPFRAVRHRVGRNLPQELQLSARRVVRCGDTFDELIEVGRIILGADLQI